MGDRGRARFVSVADGNYDMIFKFKFATNGRPEVVLRLPIPGCTAAALAVEKLENEVRWMEYMEEQHVLKVPHVYAWGTQGPGGIGPYILMDFVEGDSLLTRLKEWRFLGRAETRFRAGGRDVSEAASPEVRPHRVHHQDTRGRVGRHETPDDAGYARASPQHSGLPYRLLARLVRWPTPATTKPCLSTFISTNYAAYVT